MSYDYSDQFINKRVGSGKDERRARSADQLFAQATQPPHDDDAAAMSKLRDMSGVGASGAGWATADAQNYGRMLLSRADGSQPQYDKAHDGGGFMGSVGGVLKHLAPLAAFIPGVGPIAAGAIAAGANAGGSLMQGNGLDLKGDLINGALAGVGNAAGAGKVFGGHEAVPDIGAASSLSSPAGVMQSAGEVAKPGIFSQVASQFKTPTGGLDLSKLGSIAGAGLGVMERRQQRNSMERLYQANADASRAQTAGAEQAYAERAPLRSQALAHLGQMRNTSMFGA